MTTPVLVPGGGPRASKDKQGYTLRNGADGKEHVFKDMTDIDGLIVEDQPGGKAKILRLEQQKAGQKDTHADAKEQNDRTVQLIEGALNGGKPIRLEMEGVDITNQIDLTSAQAADKVTVGPAGKGFNESLEITAPDLERLMKELVIEAKKSGGSQ